MIKLQITLGIILLAIIMVFLFIPYIFIYMYDSSWAASEWIHNKTDWLADWIGTRIDHIT